MANPGSEFVVAYILAKWKKLAPNDFDFTFSEGFCQKRHIKKLFCISNRTHF